YQASSGGPCGARARRSRALRSSDAPRTPVARPRRSRGWLPPRRTLLFGLVGTCQRRALARRRRSRRHRLLFGGGFLRRRQGGALVAAAVVGEGLLDDRGGGSPAVL